MSAASLYYRKITTVGCYSVLSANVDKTLKDSFNLERSIFV